MTATKRTNQTQKQHDPENFYIGMLYSNRNRQIKGREKDKNKNKLKPKSYT